MLCHALSRASLLVLVALLLATLQVSDGLKPVIWPKEKELWINEGDFLEIKCTGNTPIKFTYPQTIINKVNTSETRTTENEEDGVFRYILQRPSTIFGDTGWYSCADTSVEIISDNYEDPEVNWLYVYVRSNTSFFVENELLPYLEMVTGEDVVISCRPTSPDMNVTFDIDESIEERIKSRSWYDPKIGLTIKNVTVKDSGDITCIIRMDDVEQDITYTLSVQRKHTLPQPIIHDENLRHVTRGENLHVNCTVEVDKSLRYLFDWKKQPVNSSRISIKEFERRLDKGYQEVTRQMTILNVTDKDAGEYECYILSNRETKNATKIITIHDPEVRFINLTTQSTEQRYLAEKNEQIQWVVYVDGYPKPVIQWSKQNNEEILNSTKYTVRILPRLTMLQIKSLVVLDSGNYTLTAKNDYITKKINFTLHVLAKPLTMLYNIATYYAPNQTVNLFCDVAAFPSPNITWNFIKCPQYPSRINSTTVQLTNVVESARNDVELTLEVKMTIEMTGVLMCEACNIRGCETSTEVIFVSDGIGAFAIIPPEEPVTKGDNVELICAVSVYNYTEEISWTNQKDEPIEETERIEIIRRETQFTYRSILSINKVQESDAQDYMCTGKFMAEDSDLPDSRLYKLVVNEPVLPFFSLTNMNETEKKYIDEAENGRETVVLKCIADGLPKPKVTWYKDYELLVDDNKGQYNFTKKHQELHINYMSQTDSGTYMCRATNRIGEKETYQEIIVKNGKWQQHEIILTTSLAIVAILFLIFAVFSTIKIRRNKIMKKELMEAGLMHFEEGALECLNPDLTVDDQAELLPYDKKWEFPRERLKLGKQLGSGAFGVVMKAEAQGICSSESVTTVAVKMVRRTTDPTYVRALASELKIMVHLGKHLNVVNLLGACTKNISKRELLVIVEYCRFGNLHNYLLRHRTDFVNQIDPNTGKLDNTIGLDVLTRTASINSSNRIKYAALSFSRSLSANSGIDAVHYCPQISSDSQEICLSPNGGSILSNNSSQPGWRSNYHGDYKDHNLKPICTQDLLSWAFQVARGMEYLSQRKVLHGDLAARNILLAEDNIVKICDFGLAKSMYKDGNYERKGDGPLPIKWMAIESIRDRIFSTQSDIWSYGIVLWEFFTLAETPYPGMEAEKQYQKLIEGYRMEQPQYAMSDIYDIMLQCWKAKPTLRPSFTDLVKSIGDLLDESVKSHYISLNTPYMDMNTMILEGGKNDYLTMMSAPDHAALSSPTDYVNSPFSEIGTDSAYLRMSPGGQTDESGIFSPRPNQIRTHFEFPSPVSDSEDAVEQSPMLKQEPDPYLKPINVQERRAEFARQRQAMKDQLTDRPVDRDSGYCNAPRNLHLIDLDDVDESGTSKEQADKSDSRKMDYPPSIISTQDNYVNMPKQKSDLRNGMPDSFSNPSYVILSPNTMLGNCEMDQRA
ncbi:PREDICTED: vascular endothelial growth factor receptor 1 [Dinoponera quadriceps]|uniref:receptor protein-tyrosine kinase n=1 Tax=Dinoponera quadriceps TaxID=609295 RepID=A0A6P3WYJ0_DINQU|nr:PREDICTED: vascular endothelial growth factor receptor 1 [Dinoponera quadriceps]